MNRETRASEPRSASEQILDRLGEILRGEERLDVFVERAISWEQLPSNARLPIANLMLDRVDYMRDGSTALRWRTSGRYTIDCLGFGTSGPIPGGHRAGDREAASEARRAARLVRQVLMDQRNQQLGLQGTVSTHWVESAQMMPPSQDYAAAHRCMACRIEVRVEFYEDAAEVEAEPFELSIRAEDGQSLHYKEQ